MKLQKLNKENVALKKSEMATIKGGTSSTVYTQTGIAENEYEDCNGNGKLDADEAKNKPVLVDLPFGC
jgi:hypothetical protein